jgi:hypothetical protein
MKETHVKEALYNEKTDAHHDDYLNLIAWDNHGIWTGTKRVKKSKEQ